MSSASGPSTAIAVSDEPLAHAGPEQLHEARLRRRSPRRARAARACAGCAGGRARPRSTTARAAGARPGRRAARGRAHVFDRRSIATSCSTCSFQTNEAPRSLASVVFATRQPSCSGPMRCSTGTSTLVEEDLVELALAGDLAQRADLDALRRHRDRQHRDPLVRRRVRVGPHERDAPVGEARRTTTTPSGRSRRRSSPRFSARVESAGEVAPGVGLAEQLAPDVVAGEDPRHPPPALLLGAVRHQRRPDEA